MVPTAGATGGAGDLSAFGWRLMECEESGKAIALAWFAVGFFPMPDFQAVATLRAASPAVPGGDLAFVGVGKYCELGSLTRCSCAAHVGVLLAKVSHGPGVRAAHGLRRHHWRWHSPPLRCRSRVQSRAMLKRKLRQA